MALKVKAVERKIKFSKNENDPGVYRYVMSPELYIALSQAKVIREAALRSGVSQGVMKACWDAADEVIKADQRTTMLDYVRFSSFHSLLHIFFCTFADCNNINTLKKL
jgi:hypothetical protein